MASVVVLTRLGAPRGMTSVVRLRVMTRPCRAFGLLDVASVVVLTRLGAPRGMTSVEIGRASWRERGFTAV